MEKKYKGYNSLHLVAAVVQVEGKVRPRQPELLRKEKYSQTGERVLGD